MKYNLPCAVIRDLLPSYVDALTEAETTNAVKEHLENCADCKRRYEAMISGEAIPATQEKEVDYLKTVRKRNGKTIILAVALAVVLVLAGVCTKLFWIGSPCDGSSVAINAALSEDNTELLLTLDEINSGSALRGLKTETRDGVLRITAREVLVSPFHNNGSASMHLLLDGIQRVEIFGRTVWQDGLLIDYHTGRLFSLKTPYVGSAPAVNNLISNMDLDPPHTLELQTAQEPYGLTIHFTKSIEANRRFMVEGNAYILLALVDNLGVVSWDDPSGYSDTLTLKDANSTLADLAASYNTANHTNLLVHNSIKGYGADLYNLQLLRDILGV